MTLDELWKLYPIQLSEHKEYWKDWYQEEKKFLSSFLPENVQIYHIGSTEEMDEPDVLRRAEEIAAIINSENATVDSVKYLTEIICA
ncbi:MAG: GrpB family protein [Clostridiaceae bacterium]|jgi:hypothetical protein|nr:GrpB family protein [Clostridiaceae bacterium]